MGPVIKRIPVDVVDYHPFFRPASMEKGPDANPIWVAMLTI
jgi:hypothetical protein